MDVNTNIGMCIADEYRYEYMQYIPYRLHENCSLGITNRVGGLKRVGLVWSGVGIQKNI